MSERRYNEREVAAIFRTAAETTESSARPASAQEGLTLADLQAIGRDVGLAPEAVLLAASSVSISGEELQHSFLGLPLGVGRTIELDRRLTDDEWELLVVQLREAFHARGKVSEYGSFRQWTNGNLQALLEPTPTGQRLRLWTLKGSARKLAGAGFAIMGMAGVVAVATGLSGHVMDALPGISMLALAGAAMIANGLLRLPSWARIRSSQMDAIVAKLALASQARTTP